MIGYGDMHMSIIVLINGNFRILNWRYCTISDVFYVFFSGGDRSKTLLFKFSLRVCGDLSDSLKAASHCDLMGLNLGLFT